MIRNIYIKTAAFILNVLCVAMAVYVMCTAIFINWGEYDFSPSYETSSIPRQYIANRISYLIDEDFSADFEGTEYYVRHGDKEFTNSGIKDKTYYESGGTAFVTRSSKKENTLEYIRLTNDKDTAFKNAWTAGEAQVKNAANICIACIVGMILLSVYMFWTCGRKQNSEDTHTILIDRLPVEINMLICGLSVLPISGVICLLGDNFPDGYAAVQASSDFFAKILSLGTAVSYALVMTFLMSLVRNLKNRTFLKRSIIFIVLRFAFKTAKKIFLFAKRIVFGTLKGIWHFVKRCVRGVKNAFAMMFVGRLEIILLAIYSFVLFILAVIFAVCIDDAFFIPLFLALLLSGAALRFAYKRISGLENVREGVRQIRGGNIDYLITLTGDKYSDELGENINTISDGLRKSVERELSAERMKAELITNVSHDLKTPLTAIINYADLLCEQTLTPPEANDYAAVIKKKSERLKKLTQDLFDVSKAQSGSEELNFEKIDVALLMRQSLGELDDSIQKSALDFRVNIPEGEINITADGKKLSRVFENLIGNILKYSMEKSRVYINLNADGGRVCAEFKNISAYPMDFDGEYITERFVRGDKARTSEGSGLGLAIAKSYTELCGGEFKVTVDGDLFKVCVRFNV